MAVHAMLDDAELKVHGIEVLNKALGHTAALRFLTILGREPTDYVRISHRLYGHQTVDDIFRRAKANWKRHGR
jgi:hypothetical protein